LYYASAVALASGYASALVVYLVRLLLYTKQKKPTKDIFIALMGFLKLQGLNY